MDVVIFGQKGSAFCGSSHRIGAVTRTLLRELKHLNKHIHEHKSWLNQEHDMPNRGEGGVKEEATVTVRSYIRM